MLGTESERQGDIGKRREGEEEKKARGRPTKAVELAKQRVRTSSLGSVKDFLQKKKREGADEEAEGAEKEIIGEIQGNEESRKITSDEDQERGSK